MNDHPDDPEVARKTVEMPFPPSSTITREDRELLSAKAENEKLRKDLAGLERQLTESVDSRRRLLRQLDYLGRVAIGNDRGVIEESPEIEGPTQSVIVESHSDPDTLYRVEFDRQGPVAIAASQMYRIHARLAEALQRIEDGLPVEAVVLPDWVDGLDASNVGLVSATGQDGLIVQRNGPYSPPEAVVVAAWLLVMSKPHLDDVDDAFDYLVDSIHNS